MASNRKKRTVDGNELVASPLVIPSNPRRIIADIAGTRYEKVLPVSPLQSDYVQSMLKFCLEASSTELTALQVR